ncbi:DegP [Oceaniovalibus guishaninsula JLT2003]|uniref:DegP n=1 Tax=Oceaniovalibus guishaninsula JLT2003 TaxID=1231392 RepID=K2H7A2_9RHOB|nr:trypsin-like peptidase domain-containing protein [Oceaniovalibus guishaninsula]EKE43498.1 DegP [Oceaniovalibus guishaninsula JLT2003]
MQAKAVFLVICAAFAGFGAAIGWWFAPVIERVVFDSNAAPAPILARGDLAENEAATIALFESARGSVVFIATTTAAHDFWRRRTYETPRGTGSGFVWDDRGHIVTNAHVIANANRATVRLADGGAYPARLVGIDRTHDLAVLRIDTRGVPLLPVALGTSADLRVGQTVFAIGNPFGLDFTLTTGIISALERELPGEGSIVIRGLVQTDAAINPGNSGGPLLDSAGRLIGVNTAIYSPSGASAGIGFAVPVDTVNRVVPQLIARGRYSPPGMGIVTDPRADALLARTGRRGAVVLAVEEGSPAAEAGIVAARLMRNGNLVPGDIIVGIDDHDISTGSELSATLDRYRAGQSVTVHLLRDGRRQQVDIVLQSEA